MLHISLDYLAGFIDGEGYFTICKAPSHSKTFGFRLGIVNTDLELLKLIQIDYNGNLHENKRQNKLGKRRCWTLEWSGSNAIEMSKLLKDKLIIKKEQAEIFSQITINAMGKCHNIDPKENDLRSCSRAKIMNLNKIGREVIQNA